MRGDWFKQARFGMFIHWGPYSLHGRCVWARYRERMPAAEYEQLAHQFDARNYRPNDWVEAAWNAGMRYMVLCTRQHPGFSLFDSKVSDFTAVKCGPKRDLVAEYVEACRRRGMRIGFYYSLLDWRFPAYFAGPRKDPKGWQELLEYIKAQVRELCSNYGKIDVLWYDGYWPWKPEDWKSRELNAMVRELQPDILLNNRSGLDEDFGTPEQRLGGSEPSGRMWESCITMNDHWGYNPVDKNWKPVRELIHTLVQCAAYGGNLLLDVGPMPDGRFPREAVKRLEALGRWMKRHSEAIHGNDHCPLNKIHGASLKEDTLLSKQGLTSWKDGTIYLHIFHWPGSRIILGNLKSRVLSARLITTGKRADYRQEEDRLILENLPKKAPDPFDSVIALEIDGEPKAFDDFRFIP